MTDEIDEALTTVGPRLRVVRERRQATLAQLSQATGISVSTLSRLESGGRKPTLELLLPLALLYQVPLDTLIGAPPLGDPRARFEATQMHDMTAIPLARQPGGVRAHKLIIPETRSTPNLQVHEGFEWIY